MRVTVMILLFLTAACTSATDRRGCRSVINDAITKAGLSPDQVTLAAVSRDHDSGEDGRVIGTTYWLRPASCPSGYLIVDTDEFCYVQQVYTTGACQVPGTRQN